MFSDATIAAIVSLAAVDKGVTQDERERLDALLVGKARCEHSRPFVTYRQASKELNIPTYTIKRLVKVGRLRPVIGTGKRAIGISWDSYNRFLNGDNNNNNN